MVLDVTLFEDPYEAIHFQKLLQEMGVTVYIIMTNFDLVQFLTENSIVYFSFRSLISEGIFIFMPSSKKSLAIMFLGEQAENENTLWDIASFNVL